MVRKILAAVALAVAMVAGGVALSAPASACPDDSGSGGISAHALC